ncbi:hypothetical protein CDCA_CDCA19G4679 [Cyanidium caldarium]|uniref:Nudix hydrolase domain-containing protein n=1 Tax=Cyanidium caldarium TaxID=2771 RepID=A0AAV9J2U4_CYACA|nr:hypothetical protein CDCA_CDCA19G4679 [Cyanidium caldarium]
MTVYRHIVVGVSAVVWRVPPVIWPLAADRSLTACLTRLQTHLRHSHQPPECLVVRRAREPARGQWALPGGHLQAQESVLQAVARELVEEVHLQSPDYVLGPVRCVTDLFRPESATHYVLLTATACARGDAVLQPGDDADAVQWMCLEAMQRDDAQLVPGCYAAARDIWTRVEQGDGG